MFRFLSRRLVVTAVLLLPASVSAQRDRDAYNPNNQGFEVSGQVSLSESGAPAQNIPVRLEKFSGGLIDQMNTDGRGRFRFPNLSRGYYRIIINTPGLKPAQQDADLQVIAKTYLVFELVADRPSALAASSLTPDVVDVRVPAASREEFVLGRAALARKSYPEAITHLQRAVSGYPQFFEARLLLATAFIDMREWSKAEEVLHSTLELRPDSATTLISLGEVYWRKKRFKEAEETLLAGLKLDDKAWSGYFTLGRLYWDLNDIPRAGAAVGRTLQLKADFAEGHLLAGNILLRLDQQERAVSAYQEYLKLAPKGEFAPQTRALVTKLQKAIAERK
jgi:tetratricopeptide (TPR) repeat protein